MDFLFITIAVVPWCGKHIYLCGQHHVCGPRHASLIAKAYHFADSHIGIMIALDALSDSESLDALHDRELRDAARWARILEPWTTFLLAHTRCQLMTDTTHELLMCVRLLPPTTTDERKAHTERIQTCREALELLAILAAVDPQTLTNLLIEACGCMEVKYVGDWMDAPRFWLKLGDSHNASTFDVSDYRAFFCDFDCERTAFRDAVSEMQSGLSPEERFKLWRRSSFSVYVRFVPPRAIASDELSTYLEAVVAFVRDTTAKREQPTVVHPHIVPTTLELDDIELHTPWLRLPRDASTQLLTNFVTLPVASTGMYPGVDIGFVSGLDKLSVAAFAPLITTIVNRPGLVRLPTRVPAQPPTRHTVYIMSRNKVSSREANHWLTQRWKAMCSAMLVAEQPVALDVYNIAYGTAFGMRGKRYQWLAYALLSKDATTRVTSLTLQELDFYQGDMNAMLSVLNAANPARKLSGFLRTDYEARDYARQMRFTEDNMPIFEDGDNDDDDDDDADPLETPGIRDDDPDVRAYYGEVSSAVEDQQQQSQATTRDSNGDDDIWSVRLTQGTTVTLDALALSPSADAESETLAIDTDRICRVIAIDPDSALVHIIVPGYGTGTVPRELVDSVVAGPVATRAQTSFEVGYHGSITALQLSYDIEVDIATFLPLLEYIGPKLKSLVLADRVFVTAASLERVLVACPNLETLKFQTDNEAPSVSEAIEDVVLRAYATHQCRATCLRIGNIVATPATERLLRAFADSTTAIAQTVEKLTLLHAHGIEFGYDMITSAIAMLRTNATLAHFEMNIYPDEADEFDPALLETSGQAVRGVHAPLPVVCRAAFLSVLAHFASRDCHDSASSSLDPCEPSKSKRARLSERRSGVDIERLDRGVLALIFQFAATRATRRVRLLVADDDSIFRDEVVDTDGRFDSDADPIEGGIDDDELMELAAEFAG